MRVIVTYTVFTDDHSFMKWFSTSYVEQIGTHLNYKLIKRTVGKHVDSNRTHYHVMCCYELDEHAKKYKVLNEKILRCKDIIYAHKDYAKQFDKMDKKISFMYSDSQKYSKGKIKTYDEICMEYPFKEYTEDKQVPVELCKGYDYEEINSMRKAAHIMWRNAKKKQEDYKAKKEAEKDHLVKLNDYLEKEFKDNDNYIGHCLKDKLRITVRLILQYKKLEHQQKGITSIRMNALKDQAMSWLYFTNRIIEDEILDYMYI